jgi:uncharacterized protein (TIGR02391 family)
VREIIKAALDSDDLGRFSVGSWKIRGIFPDDAYQREYLDEHLPKYETALLSIIQKYEILGIKEEPAVNTGSKDTVKLPIQLFDAMKFHPRIIQVSESLFKTGNYASAIFEASKAVHNYVRDKTGLPSDLDGVNLMERVFNENKPILQLNELLDQSDKNEQKGFKLMFMGSQMGIRNPKAHENVKQEDPNRTLEYLSMASLLMKRIDESKLVKLNIKEHKS